jgi:lipoate-protein ligase A
MTAQFRVIDTGLREGRANIAFDQAMIEGHKAGDIPDTIRFLRFSPTALVGRHQALRREVRIDHCRANNIGVGRRITGGGALYLDEGQLGWELVFARKSLGITDLTQLTRAICEAAAAGLRRLGVDAAYRPRNDIEVEGRKLCGTGGFFDGDTLFYQGTLLIDMNPQDMVAALNVPEAKLAKRKLDSAADRIVTLRQLLGDGLPDNATIQNAMLAGFAQELDIAPVRGEVAAREEALAQTLYDSEIGTDDFVYEIDDPDAGDDTLSGNHTGPGGTVTVYLRREGAARNRVSEILFTGDFFITPPRMIFDLEAHLCGVPIAGLAAATERFLTDASIGLLTISPRDFAAAVADALG